MAAKICQDIIEPLTRRADEVIACRLRNPVPNSSFQKLGDPALESLRPCQVPGSALTFPRAEPMSQARPRRFRQHAKYVAIFLLSNQFLDFCLVMYGLRFFFRAIARDEELFWSFCCITPPHRRRFMVPTPRKVPTAFHHDQRNRDIY